MKPVDFVAFLFLAFCMRISAEVLLIVKKFCTNHYFEMGTGYHECNLSELSYLLRALDSLLSVSINVFFLSDSTGICLSHGKF